MQDGEQPRTGLNGTLSSTSVPWSQCVIHLVDLPANYAVTLSIPSLPSITLASTSTHLLQKMELLSHVVSSEGMQAAPWNIAVMKGLGVTMDG